MAIKRSLLVGINYPGTPNVLRGCVNDIQLWNQVLTQQFGFTDNLQKRMLTDASATTANIKERLYWLTSDLQPGDTIFFAYSGHGSQILDVDYDFNNEADGKDEIICPVDLDWRTNIITDDDFKTYFERVPTGVNITVVLDCCHSGSGIRSIDPLQLPTELRDDLVGPTRTRYLAPPPDIAAREYGLEVGPKPRTIISPEFAVDYEDQAGLLISGCKDNQTSADAWIQPERKYHGALTYYLIQELKKANWQITYRDLVKNVNGALDRFGYSQDSELNGHEKFFDKPFLGSLS